MADLPRADIRLGYLCNHNCKFCCVSGHRKDNLSTEQAINEIINSKKFGAEKLVFTGGETTIRKDIFKLVSKGKEIGFKEILIITNGQMVSYPDFLDKLVKSGLTAICYSVPDHRKTEFEYLTQVKGSYDRLMKAVENTTKHDLQVSTISVINKLNYKNLVDLTSFLIKLNSRFKKYFSEFIFINPTDNAWIYREELVPKLSDVKPFVHESLDLAKKNNLALQVEAIPLCFMEGYFDKVVEFNMAQKRTFYEDGQRDDQYNKTRTDLGKTKSKVCCYCKYNDVCEGIWRNYVKIYSDKELNPIS